MGKTGKTIRCFAAGTKAGKTTTRAGAAAMFRGLRATDARSIAGRSGARKNATAISENIYSISINSATANTLCRAIFAAIYRCFAAETTICGFDSGGARHIRRFSAFRAVKKSDEALDAGRGSSHHRCFYFRKSSF